MVFVVVYGADAVVVFIRQTKCAMWSVENARRWAVKAMSVSSIAMPRMAVTPGIFLQGTMYVFMAVLQSYSWLRLRRWAMEDDGRY